MSDNGAGSVVVTGATGGAGRWIVDGLAGAGWNVVGVDLDRPAGARENATFLAADLTDQGQAWEFVQSVDPDAVVHFAAVPAMGIQPGTRTFENNVVSAYNALVAAGTVGARVIWASSESAYGTAFAEEPWLPEYLPLDEAHPLRPEDPYGAPKVVGEEIARMVARRYGIDVASIRPSWINYPGRYETRPVREAFDPERAEPSGNFWSYVDVRDVVSIVERALEADFDGHEAFLAAVRDNYLDQPTVEAIEAAFGDLPERCELEGDRSAMYSRKAADVLGWEPTHSWRTAETEDAPGPEFT